MDQSSVDSIIRATHKTRMALTAALALLALFLLVATVSAVKSYRLIGSGVSATNTITVSGDGEVFAVPDTAEFSVSVQETAKDVKTSQEAATKKMNAIRAFLKEAGVDEKDIRTSDYSVSPQYEWTQGACTSTYCPPGKQTLTGFQTSETLTVKVKDTDKAGELLAGVGEKGAAQVSGLSFTIADEDALKEEAREKAIAKARAKAEQLADSLGVSLVRIVGFSEGEGGYPPVPMYARADMAYGMGGAETKAIAPEISVGQNKIVSNVTISFEIQ